MDAKPPSNVPLSPPGWPRPRRDGYPIPWVAIPDNLGRTDGARFIATKRDLLCQVCGEAHDKHDEVVVFVGTGLESKSGKAVDPTRPGDVLIRCLDDAIMHERCARLAAGSCPALKAKRERGEFFAFIGPLFAVVQLGVPLEERDPERIGRNTFLALEGDHARPFDV